MKKNKQKKIDVELGFSSTKTTFDNGCGIHKDKRTKRKRTRKDQERAWKKDHEV